MKILLSGGGTAGHINPALAIAKYAKEKDKNTEVLFMGTRRGLESTLVPKENFDISFVNVDGLKKEISVKSAVSCAKLVFATAKAVAIIKKFGPDIVVGTGGYVCVPAILGARILGIPAAIHEQNVFPGAAVRFLADKCAVTLTSFEESKKYLSNATRLELTGNPIRPSILKHSKEECMEKLGINGKKVILAFGGSLGAMKINDVMTEYIKRKPKDAVIFFATGERDFERITALVGDVSPDVRILRYIDNMDVLMNAADVVICRSGAITLAELCAIGKPAVLIPSPNVTNNHQEYNARALSDRGAAITITENNFNAESLDEAISKILNDSKYAEDMSVRSKELGITDASKKIYDIMVKHTGVEPRMS